MSRPVKASLLMLDESPLYDGRVGPVPGYLPLTVNSAQLVKA